MPVGRPAGSVAAVRGTSGSRAPATALSGGSTRSRAACASSPAHGTPTAVALGRGKAILVADAPEHKVVVARRGDRTPQRCHDARRSPGATSCSSPRAERACGRRPAQRRKHRTRRESTTSLRAASRALSCDPGDETAPRLLVLVLRRPRAGDGAVWLAGDAQARVVWRLDPSTHRVAAHDPPAVHPERRSRPASGAVWVTSLLGDTVSRIDPRTNRIVGDDPGRPRRRLRSPPATARVWVTSAIDDALCAHRPANEPVVATIPLDGTPRRRRGRRRRRLGDDHEAGRALARADADAIRIGVYADCQGIVTASRTTTAWRAPSCRCSSAAAGSVPNRPTGSSGASVAGRPIRLYLRLRDDDGSSTARRSPRRGDSSSRSASTS